MSITDNDVAKIADALKSVIVEPLRDVATASGLSAQLIRDTLNQLKECKAELDMIRGDMERAVHHGIDAETSIKNHQYLAEVYKKRVGELEIRLIEKQAEIVSLRRQIEINNTNEK